MKVLLDTCCVIWAVSDPKQLSERATGILQDSHTEVFVSPISAAEIACASARKRIAMKQHWKSWFRHHLEFNGWQTIDIGLEIIEEAYSLPDAFHADPADRIITATARVRRLRLLTADKRLLRYPHVETAW